MKKEIDEMLIITEDELEVIIQPNDVLTKNMETLVYGGGPGGLPGGGDPGGPTGSCDGDKKLVLKCKNGSTLIS